MSEILITKKIIYSTKHYQNNYNQDKNNKRSNHRCDTGHIKGQQDTTETQDNSKNMITFQQAINHQNNESEEIGGTLAEILTLINRCTSSTEAVIVPETQDNSQSVNSPFQQTAREGGGGGVGGGGFG